MDRPYMAHTGTVISVYDGQEHIVRAGRVADLYGVPKKLCHMIDNLDEMRGWSDDELAKLIHLVPRQNADDYKTIPARGVVPND